MSGTIMALALAIASAEPDAAQQDGCSVDTQAMLGLGIHAFDQDMDGGWRALAHRPGCERVAADLIRTYRIFVESRLGLLYWHEGQLRAGLGQAEAAIALFDQSRRQDDDEYGWNAYVDATIAFLRSDRVALLAARERLARARVPEPAPGGPAFRAPMNLDVVDALIRCFDRPYAEAYGAPECRRPDMQADGR